MNPPDFDAAEVDDGHRDDGRRRRSLIMVFVTAFSAFACMFLVIWLIFNQWRVGGWYNLDLRSNLLADYTGQPHEPRFAPAAAKLADEAKANEAPIILRPQLEDSPTRSEPTPSATHTAVPASPPTATATTTAVPGNTATPSPEPKASDTATATPTSTPTRMMSTAVPSATPTTRPTQITTAMPTSTPIHTAVPTETPTTAAPPPITTTLAPSPTAYPPPPTNPPTTPYPAPPTSTPPPTAYP